MELYTINNPAQHKTLTTPTQPITDTTPQEVIDQLNAIYDLVKNPKSNARWLALPQIGQSYSAFVICAPDNTKPTRPGKRTSKATYLQGMFINPVITDFSDTMLPAYKETCLSEPGTYRRVKRPAEITITYTNQNWQLREDVIISWNRARVIQHEYDHLRGKLLSDSALTSNSRTTPAIFTPDN